MKREEPKRLFDRRCGQFKKILLASATAAFCTFGVVAPAATHAQAPQKPNIIVILVDDLGWPDVSTYGRNTVPTPNIDRIAHDGVGFTNGYVAAPVCAVSRAGLLTGYYPERFGFEYNLDDGKNKANGLSTDVKTMGDRLHEVGYRTAIVGKWHQGWEPKYYPTNRGFDEFFGFLAGETTHINPNVPGYVTVAAGKIAADATDRKEGGRIIEGPNATPVNDYDKYTTTEFTDRAVKFIGENAKGKRPFFLYLAYNSPHAPFQVPQSYYDKFPDIQDKTRRTYVAMISNLDDSIGRVMSELKKAHIDKNTLVVFLSDNGCPAQLGSCDCSHPFGAGKFTQLEGGYHIPFVMSWKGVLKPHKVLINTPVSSLDIMPTVLNAAGAEVPKDLDGVNLLDTIDGKAKARPLFWRQDPILSVRDGDWKLWVERDTKEMKLYNLASDISEQNDVAKDHPDVVNRLKSELDQWDATLAKPAWPIRYCKDVTICGRPTKTVY